MRKVNPTAPRVLASRLVLWFFKIVLLVLAVAIGVKISESYLIYSSQAGGLSGLTNYQEKYEAARTGQLLTVTAFISLQVAGGFLLRSLLFEHRIPIAWGLWRFVGAHLLLTVLAIAAIALGAIFLR